MSVTITSGVQTKSEVPNIGTMKLPKNNNTKNAAKNFFITFILISP
jgi:hypothetical protein